MASTSPFSVPQARILVRDLYGHRAAVYWIDFLVSLLIGYGAATVYLQAPFTWPGVIGFVIAGFALYRVALFMHEVVHFRKGEMRGFAVTWNVLAGIPMMMPSYFYESHMGHHNTHFYGTARDGEYLPLGNGPVRNIFFFMLQVFVQPVFVVFRFVVLTPLSFLHPSLRRWTLRYASSFVINFLHRREIPADAPRKAWALMDLACCIRASLIFILVFAHVTPWYRVPQLYCLSIFILSMNHFRTLAAHRYQSDGRTMTHQNQFFDSTIITGMPVITELLCPVGLRYHALHHLFPAMPYHNLPVAHQRLMEHLPAESEYREVVYPGFTAVIRELVSQAAASSRLRPSKADRWLASRREIMAGGSGPAHLSIDVDSAARPHADADRSDPSWWAGRRKVG